METDTQFVDKLQQWLLRHWAGVDALAIAEGISKPEGSGYSATTMIIPVRVTRRGETRAERIVVRMEPESSIVYPKHCSAFSSEIEQQYRAIELLGAYSDVPVAPLIALEPDPSLLGLPFFVMEYIGGDVPIEDPIYTREGFFAEAAPAQRKQMLHHGLQTMANIHRIDWRKAGADWLVDGGPDLRRDLRMWQDHARKELAGRVHPDMDRAFDWLFLQLGSGAIDTGEPVICWGDARPGNIIWRDFTCQCVCDFESMTLAPAATDIGWWLMFDRYAHEAQGVERLAGEPTRAEQQAYFEQCSGREFGDLYFYELYAAVRYSVLVVSVINRWVKRGVLPDDHTIWLENPVAAMMKAMMSEHEAA
jgi:aminoglycoside phosphotransferase (APT) family kinase protein